MQRLRGRTEETPTELEYVGAWWRAGNDVIDRAGLAESNVEVRCEFVGARDRAKAYTREHGIDIPEVADWVWPGEARGN